jgi:hypothetical protein
VIAALRVLLLVMSLAGVLLLVAVAVAGFLLVEGQENVPRWCGKAYLPTNQSVPPIPFPSTSSSNHFYFNDNILPI